MPRAGKTKAAHISRRFCIEDGDKFKLKDFDPADTAGLDKDGAVEILARGLERLTELQAKLYAQQEWALLVVLQGLDASGKDGVIKHVMSGLNPLGCRAYSFRAPVGAD
ncbi:MAG: polyphosphate kinase 2 family protein, partial [Chloroflexota bacterium]